MDNRKTQLPQTTRILVVDDHPNTAAMLARVLSKFETPVEVLTALSAEDALELIDKAVVDILITDFMMAGMNGLDLIENLKANGKEPSYIIFITAYDTPGLKISAQRLKINEYLVKPVQPEKIREIVARVLQDIRPQPDVASFPASQRPFKILIADDNVDNVRLLSVRLRSEGYDFITATDGLETLKQIHKESPDLVLLDVNMPNKDGFEVLLEMRADAEISHIPVIIVTAARIAAKDVREGLTLGADDYVTKPIDWRELSARIRTKLRVKHAEDALRLRNRELGVLPELSKDLGERLDVEELTRTILERSVNAMSASNGHLVIFHPDGTVTQQVHSLYDVSPWNWEQVKEKLLQNGPVAQTSSSREAIIIENTQSHPNWVKIPNDPSQSAILMPLRGRRDVLGVLTITNDKVGYFTSEHMKLLQAIASQAAIAIENAQLYAIEKKRVDELVALNQLTHQISQYTHSTNLFKNIPDVIRQHLPYPTVALWLKIDEIITLESMSGGESAPRCSLMEIAAQQAAVTGQPAQFSGSVEERTGERFGKGSPPILSSIAVPLVWDNEVRGVISIHSQRSSSFQESDRVLLETLASQIGIVIERIGLFESVEQEQKRMSAILRTAADAILVMSSKNELQLVNPAGEQLFTDVEVHIDRPLPVNKGYDELIDLIDTARKSGKLEKGEIRWPDQRTFSALVAPIEEGGQVAVLHDVSHFMKINQLKNEFLATATHDLKNPIFTVLGYSDLIERVGPLNEMQQDFLRRIRNSAHMMQDLVLNLLEMARIEMESDLKKEHVEINVLLREIAGEFQAQVDKKQLRLVTNLLEDSVRVLGDKLRLQQVARNLLGNAIKYTPSGGVITLTSQIKNSIVEISIQDTGIGIPEDALPHIFDKFYRVNSEETKDIEGNGLGLAIVKAIIEQHKGQIRVNSKLGEGSCFSLLLPLIKR